MRGTTPTKHVKADRNQGVNSNPAANRHIHKHATGALLGKIANPLLRLPENGLAENSPSYKAENCGSAKRDMQPTILRMAPQREADSDLTKKSRMLIRK